MYIFIFSLEMQILVAPVSGGWVPSQLASMLLLLEKNYKPDVILAASGGAIASTLMLASHYESNRFKQLINCCGADKLFESWLPRAFSFIPSQIIGFFTGSFFRHAQVNDDYLASLISPAMLTETDFWILTYNLTQSRPTLHHVNSTSRLSITDSKGPQKKPLVNYLNSNLEIFGQVLRATSSIPTFSPSVLIANDHHVDGGLGHASPLSCFRQQLLDLDNWHLIYISGNDPYEEQIGNWTTKSIIYTAKTASSTMVSSGIMTDITTCYDLLERKAGKKKVKERKTSLAEYFRQRNLWSCSVLQMYPKEMLQIDIDDFTGPELLRATLDQVEKIQVIVWYF